MHHNMGTPMKQCTLLSSHNTSYPIDNITIIITVTHSCHILLSFKAAVYIYISCLSQGHRSSTNKQTNKQHHNIATSLKGSYTSLRGAPANTHAEETPHNGWPHTTHRHCQHTSPPYQVNIHSVHAPGIHAWEKLHPSLLGGQATEGQGGSPLPWCSRLRMCRCETNVLVTLESRRQDNLTTQQC